MRAILATLFLLMLTFSLTPGLAEVKSNCPTKPDFGDWVYMNYPDVLMRAIRVAEGVPSYGVMALSRVYGDHRRVPPQAGRAAAATIVHKAHRDWRAGGCPQAFLTFLAYRYAPPGAANDPGGLNTHWLENVALNMAMQLVTQ